MVQLEYVKRIKRRKISALIAAIGAVVTSVFVIVSFLGDRIGSFTINILNNDVALTLSNTSDFAEQTTFMRVDSLQSMNLYCFDDFSDGNKNIDFSEIDNEENPSTMGAVEDKTTGEITSYNYFKYTYFVKNIGINSARYEFDLNILSNSADSVTQKRLDSYLRAVVIEDGNYRVFAKRSNDATHYETGKEDEKSSLEYICCGPQHTKRDYGLAEEFFNETVICSYQDRILNPGEQVRYTLLFWLEGDDAEATGFASKECKLRLGVEIKAYEN